MKYIILEKANMEFAVLFPEPIEHIEACSALIKNKQSLTNLVSAGFCKLHEDGSVECFGKSDSLNLSARPGPDAEAIQFSLSLKHHAYA